MTKTHDRRPLSRRTLLCRTAAGVAAGAVATASRPLPAAQGSGPEYQADPFRYCLNTGTIRGQKLSLPQEISIAAKAGYQAIEPWLPEIAEFVQQGGSLADLKKQAGDLGLCIESVIGFTNWISEEPDRGPGGLEQWKRDLEQVAAMGGKRLCAPPTGIAYKTPQNLFEVARRYRTLLELGRQFGVVPQVELWGRARTLCRLGEVALVMVEAAHADACAVLDVFHIYKGGSDFGGVRLLNGATLHSFHMNDYPADPPRATITDASRVYPGDGIAPLAPLLRDLRAIGFRRVLSLEIFNREYWKQDPLLVARTGLEKMRGCVAVALQGRGDDPPRNKKAVRRE